MKKKLLYLFFLVLIAVSGGVYYMEANKPASEPEIDPHLLEAPLNEIETDEKDKQDVIVEKLVIKMAPDVDLNKERKKYNNNDIIGRLEIPGLFNIIVAKDPYRGTDPASNPFYYLSHSLYKKSDIKGSEFMDYQVKPTSKQVNIYGHNTRDSRINVPFLKLEKFLKKDFFEKNPYVIFQYDGGKSVYKIKAIKQVYDTNNEHLYVNKKGSEFVTHVKNITSGKGLIFSRDIPVDENSEILVLQTCSHDWNNAYYIITAVKIDY